MILNMADISNIKITDRQVMIAMNLDVKNTSSNVAIPVSTLANGIYFVQTQTASGTHTDKIVIRK